MSGESPAERVFGGADEGTRTLDLLPGKDVAGRDAPGRELTTRHDEGATRIPTTAHVSGRDGQIVVIP